MLVMYCRCQHSPGAPSSQSRQKLCLNSGSASVRGAFEVCPNLKAPPDAPSFPSFWRMLRRYDPSWPHISQDSVQAGKKERKRENGDIACRRWSLLRAWVAEMARPSHLTTADKVNKVSLKDSPSKITKAESFEGRRP